MVLCATLCRLAFACTDPSVRRDSIPAETDFRSSSPAGFVAHGAHHTVRVDDDGRTTLDTDDKPLGAALTLSPTRIVRGAIAFDRRGPARVAGGDVVIARTGAEERLHNGDSGLEQSWVFSSLPRGNGDLHVSITLPQGARVSSRRDGLELATSEPGARFHYGNATWIDARGVRTGVPARWLSGNALGSGGTSQIALDVPDSVLKASAYPATLDPVVSPEFALAGESIGAARDDDDTPSAAFDGTNFFVTWDDGVSGGIQVRGVRIDASGKLLDPTGITIDDGDSAFVAFGGGEYLVVYDVEHSDATTRDRDVYAARVSPAGQVLDSTPLPIATGPDYQQHASVAWCGSNFLVTWKVGAADQTSLLGVHVLPNGSIVESQPMNFTDAAYYYGAAGISRASAGCLVAWYDMAPNALTASHIGATGAPIDRFQVWPGGPQATQKIGVAYDGTDNLVAWDANMTGNWSGTYGAIVHGDGSTNGSFLISQPPPNTTNVPNEGAAQAIWDGSDYLVTWTDNRVDPYHWGLWGRRVNADGTLVDANDISIVPATTMGTETNPVMASSGSQLYLAWEDTRAPDNPYNSLDIFGTRVDLSGRMLDAKPSLLSTGVSDKDYVSLAHGGSQYFAAWHDTRGDSGGIYGARITEAGSVLDPTGRLLAAPAAEPRIDYDGTHFTVGWSVGAARVDATGSVLDPAGISFTRAPASMSPRPGFACAHSNCLIAWSIYASGPYNQEQDIAGAIVHSDGTTSPSFVISGAPEIQEAPAVASDGTNFVVVWTDCRDDPAPVPNLYPQPCYARLYGARVSADGKVLDDDAGAVQITSSKLDDRMPAIAYDSDAGQYVVTWERNRGSSADIFAARLKVTSGATAAIDLLDQDPGIAVTTAAGEQTAPAIAYTGDGYDSLIVWQDLSGTASALNGAWLNRDGQVVRTDASLAAGAVNELVPALARGPAGTALLAYGQAAIPPAGEVMGPSTVLAARLITSFSRDGTACTSDSECASGRCRDGFCCGGVCDPTCQTCGDPKSRGVCTCTGQSTCKESANVCRMIDGLACSSAADCGSGHCADGFCCDSACSGDCDTCKATPGVCSVLAKGTVGSNCAPGYLCDGVSPVCSTTCKADADCASRYYCSPQGKCTAFCNADTDCGAKRRCVIATGRCESGATCDGQHTLTEATGQKHDCTPYVCNSSGACLQKCSSSADCVQGDQCSAQGSCIAPPTTPNKNAGCSCHTSSSGGAESELVLIPLLFAWLRRRRRIVRGAAALALVTLGGCTSGAKSNPRATESQRAVPHEASVSVAPAIDLGSRGSVLSRAFQARPDGGFAVSGTRYSAVVARTGAFTFSQGVRGAGNTSFETRRIARGGAVVASNPPRISLDDGAGLALDRGPIAEHLRNTGSSIEQSWTFPTEPVGIGALDVRIHVAGAASFASDALGLILTDPRNGVRIRYGHATWIDARGVTTAVPARWIASSPSEGEIALDVPAEVLAASTYPAVLDPTISPEFSLGAAEYGVLGNSGEPAAAFDGTNYLVVWHDGNFGGTTGRGTRVSPTTGVLDPLGFALPGGVNPHVAHGSNGYLLVWENNGDIQGARLGSNGQPVDTTVLAIASGGIARTHAHVAWCGSDYLVTWTGGAGLEGARLDASGVAIDTTPIALAATNSEATLGSDGTNCLVAWNTNGIQATRVGASGPALDSPPVVLSGTSTVGSADMPSVTYDGSEYFAVWSAGTAIAGSRVTRAAVALDAPPLTVSATSQGKSAPSVAWDGTGLVVGWNQLVDANSIRWSAYGVRLDATGKVQGSEFVFDDRPASQSELSLVGDGSGALATWSVGGNTMASRFDRTNGPLDQPALLLSTATTARDGISVASDGTGFFAAWHDTAGGRDAIVGTRISATGTVQDPAGIVISDTTARKLPPTVAYDGSDYVVAWFETTLPFALTQPGTAGNIRGSRIKTDGSVLDPAGIDIDTDGKAQSAAGRVGLGCSSTECLCAWTTSTTTFGDTNIAGVLLGTDGKVSSTKPIGISTALGAQSDPTVASNGTDFVVAWTDARGTSSDVYAARVTAAGALSDSSGVAISTSDLPEAHVSIAYDSTLKLYLVAWEQAGDIRGARLRDSGTALDVLDPEPSLPICDHEGHQTLPSVTSALDGHEFFVAWQDSRDTTKDIYGSWVSETGAIRNPSGLAIATSAELERAPSVAARGKGNLLVAYELAEAKLFEPLTSTPAARLVSSAAIDGTDCSSDAQCASGRCREGVCCQSDCDTSCQTCAAAGSRGVCTCTGKGLCAGGVAACTLDTALACGAAKQCTSGFCADNVCCTSACTDGCGSCANASGTCSPIPKGDLGRNCAPGYLCDGKSTPCPVKCAADADCAPGYFCSAQNKCSGYCTSDSDCTKPSRCDPTTGKCVSGATCDHDHTVTQSDGKKIDCTPYLCTLDGTCLQKCTTSSDCIAGDQCDATGTCVAPPAPKKAASGCGCRVTDRGQSTLPHAFAWLLALVIAARRRARRPAA